MKTLILSAVILATQFAFSAVKYDRVWIQGTTDKNPLEYKTGEKIVFNIDVKDLDGTPKEGELTLKYLRSGDDGIREEGKEPFTGKSFVYETSIAKPGFVRLEVSLVDSKGKMVGKKAFFDGGAGADVKSLDMDEEPADFDEFWAKQFSRLDKVPIKAELVEYKKNKNKAVKMYAVSVACAGLRPVTGYMVVPCEVDSGKTFPARLGLHGYSGDSFTHGLPDHTLVTNGSCISLSINAHGLKLPEFGATEADRKAFYWEARSNGRSYAFDPAQNKDPETAYFNGMVLRVKRALQYLKTLKGWNKKDLIVSGGSQGGMQAVWAAACGEGVTEAYSAITWNCDIKTNAERLDESKKLASWGWYIPWSDGLRYYDVINFVKRIPVSCRLIVPRAGLGDYVCPPMGLAKMWNNARCPKKIVWVQGSQHGYVPPSYKGRDFTYEDKGEKRALTAIVPDSKWTKGWWMKRHNENIAKIKKNPPQVVFVGDSITHFWESHGKKTWQDVFAKEPYSAISLGYSGDRTEHVIWRIVEGGELDGYSAKAVVLMIGTNNTGHLPVDKESPYDTFQGISRIVALIRAKQPQAVIVLNAIFPRGEKMDDPLRRRNDEVNRLIKPLADGKNVIWCDISDSFVDEEGNLDLKVFPDKLHPVSPGYVVWAECVKPYIDWALSDRTAPAPHARFSKYMQKASATAK